MDIAIIRYLVKFMVGIDCLNAVEGIAYTKDNPKCISSLVIIRPSDFFEEDIYATKKTLPRLPLKEIDGIPILFGESKVECVDGKIIIHADLIASAYFLLSRYEEKVRDNTRDLHGRFPGIESLPYRAGFIDRPLVDEYGRFLRDTLRKNGMLIDEPQPSYSSIHLTHDIDYPWKRFSLFKAIKRILAIIIREHRLNSYPLLNHFGIPIKDPIYTFPWIIEQDRRIQCKYLNSCKVVYFAKSGGRAYGLDGFIYINTKSFKKLLKLLKDSGALLGYHASYDAGVNPELMEKELKTLNKVIGEKICLNRNHYLNSREPCDMRKLIEYGITDDFTMGYADVAGFRLGTSRSVKWIDPENVELTELTLHPLIIMECSLSDTNYMNLSEDDAEIYSANLMYQTRKHNGDLTLLWHNTSLIDKPDNRDRKLYVKIIEDLCNMDN